MRHLGLLSIFVLVGCGGTLDDPQDDSDSTIIGGKTDNGDPSVVALFSAVPGAMTGSLCTATVIAPTVLLTAAHCVAPSEVGAGVVFIGIEGTNLNKKGTTTKLMVKETHFDTAFNPSVLDGGHDIGVAILSEPTTLTPIPVNRRTPSGISSVRLVGYGVNKGTAQTGAGVKRTVKAPLTQITSKLLGIGDAKHETCQGDSGGPALATINGVETVVGITSFGQVGCTNGGFDTRVDLYTSFLDQFLN
jgi:secreted trypsin-like serine protease